MAKITIVRPYEWANQAKNINVYIDGEKAGRVASDKTVQFEVSPGKHKVEIKSKWPSGSKPLEVDISDNEDTTIRLTSSQYGILISRLIIIFAFIFYSRTITTFDFESNFLSIVLVVIFIFLLLYIPYFSRYYMKVMEAE